MRSTLTRIGWFIAIWAASVAALGAVSLVLRHWLACAAAPGRTELGSWFGQLGWAAPGAAATNPAQRSTMAVSRWKNG